MYSWLSRKLLAPTLDLFRGSSATGTLAALEESQWWGAEPLRDLQNRRLRRLADYAAAQVPYYRGMFRPGDIRTEEDLAQLPVLTKDKIRNLGPELIDPGFPPHLLKRCRTGGSTGEPARFFKCKEDYYSHEIAAKLRGNSWAGYQLGDRCVLVYERRTAGSYFGRAWHSILERTQRLRLIDALGITPTTLPAQVGLLKSFRPDFILGYPNGIALLAEHLNRSGSDSRIRLKGIITLGEPLLRQQRKLFKEVFGCEAFSFYRSHEVHALACECERREGFHVTAENVILEIVDDSNQPVAPGESGKILVTNLHSYGMPFLRYEIGDRGRLARETCVCGRGLPLLKELEGRITDILVTPTGRTVPGVALPMDVLTDKAILQFQIHQEVPERLEVRILTRDLDREQLRRLEDRVRRDFNAVFQNELLIEVNYVSWIETGPTGKRRVISSEVSRAGTFMNS